MDYICCLIWKIKVLYSRKIQLPFLWRNTTKMFIGMLFGALLYALHRLEHNVHSCHLWVTVRTCHFVELTTVPTYSLFTEREKMYWWMGFYHSEQKSLWIDGSMLAENAFTSNYNHLESADANCFVVYPVDEYRTLWLNAPCSRINPYICEKMSGTYDLCSV